MAASGRPVPTVIASDLDGTLLHSDGNAGYGTLSSRAVEAVKGLQASGGQFIIATGNPPDVVMPIARQLGCDGFYNICSDGDVVLKNGKVVRERRRPSKELARILPRIRSRFPNLSVALTSLSTGKRKSYADGSGDYGDTGFDSFYHKLCLQTMSEERYRQQMAGINEQIEQRQIAVPEDIFSTHPETLERECCATFRRLAAPLLLLLLLLLLCALAR